MTVVREKIDVIHLDRVIRDQLRITPEKIEAYRARIAAIDDELAGNDIALPSLADERDRLQHMVDNKDFNIELYNYISESKPLVDEYRELIQTPITISFNSNNNNGVASKLAAVRDRFVRVVSNYIDIDTYFTPTSAHSAGSSPPSSSSSSRSTIRSACLPAPASTTKPSASMMSDKIVVDALTTSMACKCGNDSDIYFERKSTNVYTCLRCGIEQSTYSIDTSFKDKDRVNLSKKYKYQKQINFKETINNYQGKQTRRIPARVFDQLRAKIEINNIHNANARTFHDRYRAVTRNNLMTFLSETGNSSYYKDINFIYSHFTGEPNPDISHIETILFDDFTLVSEVYDSLNLNRKKFFNGQYILFQLLRKQGEPIKMENLSMLKTRERLNEYDDIYKKICFELGWNFEKVV